MRAMTNDGGRAPSGRITWPVTYTGSPFAVSAGHCTTAPTGTATMRRSLAHPDATLSTLRHAAHETTVTPTTTPHVLTRRGGFTDRRSVNFNRGIVIRDCGYA